MLAMGILRANIYFRPKVLPTYRTNLWAVINDFRLTSIPFFVILGEILPRAGITPNMYHSLSGDCAMVSAMSGLSVTTAATIGTVALDEFKRFAHHDPLVLGSSATGATLVPAFANLVVYSAITNTLIRQLLAAGILPGRIMTGLSCWSA
jgi:TRAP-type C4-dicarboxylate transport system permease large subunit